MKKRKREKNFIRNRSGGMKRKLPGRLLSLICALILVLSTVFLDLGHISRAYAFGDELYLETEAEETAEAGIETQAADSGDDGSEINTEFTDDTSEDSDEVFVEEAKDADGADFSSGDNLDEQYLATEEEPEIADDSAAETVTYTQLINNDTVEVRAEAPAGALPEGAQLSVVPVEKETDQYTEVESKLIEQAQNNEQDLCGFLAYDISFVDAEGQKVEPAAEVKVSMEYKETAIPEEVTDAAVLNAEDADTAEAENTVQTPTVEILHFVEDQNGEVQDIVNMTQEGQANVETTSDGQIQKAEFNTGSFSVFTITWTQMKQSENNETTQTTVTVKYVDTDGKDISNLVTSNTEIKATKGTVIRLADYEPYITGYGFTKALIGGSSFDSTAPELKLIKAANNYTGYNTYWTYSYSNDTDPDNATWTEYGSGYNNIAAPTVYLVYSPMELSITDDLMTSGNLIPNITDETKAAVDAAKAAGKDVSYIWYKSINNGDFEVVDKVKVSGDKYNIETNDEGVDCLNVALDGGALSSTQSSVRYRVAIQIEDQDEIISGEYNVRYYEELHNGGFETPVVANDHSGTNNWQYSNENYRSQGGVWQTTGTNAKGSSQWCDTDGADIEIVTTATGDLSGYSWHGTVCDANEVANQGQFAELNCEAAGALYQDVITYSGEKLNFWLSHRARGSYSGSTEHDTMYVVIMPTSIAKDYTTQDQLTALIKNYITGFKIDQSYKPEGTSILYNQDGVLIERVTSDDLDWHHITETGKYTATSNMTRFFFVAGNTASGNNTVGNFLDNVGFGQGLPPANKGTFSLQVKKIISGLPQEQIDKLRENLEFEIKATDQNGNEAANTPLNGQKLKLTDDNVTVKVNETTGTYTYTWIFADQTINANTKYNYSVTESGAEVDGYTLTSTDEISGGHVNDDGKSTLIGEKDSAVFTFTNQYVNNKKKNISFAKVWDDFDNAYNTRPDKLIVTLTGTVNGKVYRKYAVTLTETAATIAKNADGVTVEATPTWKCTWKNVPVYDGDGNVIQWNVSEGTVGGSYVYESSETKPGNGSGYSKVNTTTSGNITTDEIQNADIPGGSTSATAETGTQSADAAESDDTAVMSAGVSSDEYGIATQAWNNGWGGGGNSSTFDHIDIEAVGSYIFEYGGAQYTVNFDFHAGTWTLLNESGTAINTGKLDVSTFKITNKSADSNVAISGNWQSSTTSGQTWEYRISGSFNRSHTFHVHYEIPVGIPVGKDNVTTVNLIADFDTSYNDGTYNVCPGNGNSKGIDIEMDTALTKQLTGSIVLTKELQGTDGQVPDRITFTVTGPDYNKTISYSDFSNGSYVINGLQVGSQYTITETGTGSLDGYTYTTTTVAVNGTSASDGTTTTVTTTSGMTVVVFTNTYTAIPKVHTLYFKKVWNGGNGAANTAYIDLNVTYSNNETDTIKLSPENNWEATKTVPAYVFISSVGELNNLEGYTSSVAVSADGTTAIVTNTYTSSESTSLTVIKFWENDEANTDLRTPVEVQLYKANIAEGESVTLSEENHWTHTFTDLVRSETIGEDTIDHTYTVKELTNVPGYDSKITYENNDTVAKVTNTLNADELDESFYIVNKLSTETVTVKKYWDDNHNQYGSRPSSLSINLKINNTDTKVISFNFGSGENNTADLWQATVTAPALKRGNTYYAEEVLSENSNYECVKSQQTGDDIYFVNKPKTQTIIVEKIWKDGNNANNTRPSEVNFKLQYRIKGSDNDWQDYENGDFVIENTEEYVDSNNPNYWYYRITGLPAEYEYRVRETNVPDGYEVSYNGTSVTNTLKWQMVKQSFSTGDNLGGAKFKLTDGSGNQVATGESQETTGVIQWTYSEGVTLNGTYTLTETEAPTGYQLSAKSWELTFVDGILTGTTDTDELISWDQGNMTITVKNKILYSLPSSGGPGTYMFTISGVAFITAALLLFINNKRKEDEAKFRSTH